MNNLNELLLHVVEPHVDPVYKKIKEDESHSEDGTQADPFFAERSNDKVDKRWKQSNDDNGYPGQRPKYKNLKGFGPRAYSYIALGNGDARKEDGKNF